MHKQHRTEIRVSRGDGLKYSIPCASKAVLSAYTAHSDSADFFDCVNTVLAVVHVSFNM